MDFVSKPQDDGWLRPIGFEDEWIEAVARFKLQSQMKPISQGFI
jgi:hypothetical protein